VLCYGLDDPGPTPPPIEWVTGDLSLMVKRPGREAGYNLIEQALFRPN